MDDDPAGTETGQAEGDRAGADHTVVDLSYSTLRKVQYLLGPAICLIFGLAAVWAGLSTNGRGASVGIWVIAAVAILAGVGLVTTGPKLFRRMRLVIDNAGITVELPQECGFGWSMLESVALSVDERREPMSLTRKSVVFVDLTLVEAAMANQNQMSSVLVRTDDPLLVRISLGRRQELLAPVDAALHSAAPAQIYRGIAGQTKSSRSATP